MTTRRMHRWLWPLAVVGLGVALTLRACGGASQPPIATVTFGTLKVIAQGMAADAEDPQVRSAEAVLTTDEASGARSPGTPGNPNEPAFLVQMHGAFIGRLASVPPGGKLPTGSYLFFVVEASTGYVIEWGIGTGDSHLARLGQVIPLSW